MRLVRSDLVTHPGLGRRAAAWLVAPLLLLGLALPAPSAATSVYSIGGLGEPQVDEGARVRALGGAGAAEFGVDLFSQVNPASMAGVRHLLLQGTVVPAFRRVSGTSGRSENDNETEVPSLRAALRLPWKVVVGASYGVGTDAQFKLDRAENAGTPSTLHVEGTGGIQLIRIQAAREISNSLRVGIDHEIIAGNYREEWTRDFADTSLATSRDTLESRYERLGRWRLGAQASVRGWTFGGAYETKRRLPLSAFQRAAGTTIETSGANLIIPAGFVVGASTPTVGHWRATAQYRRANWERASLASDLVDFRPLERVSVGFERLGKKAEDTRSWIGRMPWRFGVSYLRWPDLLPVAGASTIAGGTAAVNEWTLSLGSGIVTQDKGGTLDFSLEAGQRGNKDELGVSERFIRAAFTLQVGDDSWK